MAERYRLVEPVGAGGMGSVWRATHVTLSHEIAIKFLQATEVTPEARARFEREAKLAARLGEASRHITRVIDYGVFQGTTPYLVMELLQGETLSARIRREGRLPLDVTARLITQLCRALQVAHGAGVIHRDIKPSNIFLVRSEFDDEAIVKLMDFGIAKSTVDVDGDEMTGAGTVIGTPGYMSPEQLLQKRLDARTDLWGVAACVYRAVCGRTPFGNGGVAELGLRILATDPAPPSMLDPRLPASLDLFMEKALAKSAEDRYQSARDLADALSVIAGVRPAEAAITSIVPLADEVELPGHRTGEHVTRQERRKPPRRAYRFLLPRLAVVAALAALAGAVHHYRGRAAAAEAADPTPRESVDKPTTEPAPAVAALAAPPSATAVPAQPVPPTKPTVEAKPVPPPAKMAKPPQAPNAAEAARLWKRRDTL